MPSNKHTIGFTALGTAVAAALAVEGYILLTSGRPSHAQQPTPAATTPAAATPGPLLSPFTGERVTALHRVLAVKIGNTVPERPATGLSNADIVYTLPVEGGLSRIMAVFSSHYPAVTGPVRSAREDDLNLLRQFGRPAFAFSGATTALLPVVHHARIADLFDGITRGYFRSTGRTAPYNLYAHTHELLAQAPRASKARDIGFRFGPPPPGGRVTHAKSVSYPAASFRFTWSAARQRWLVWIDGARAMTTEAGQLGAATVIIQHTTIRTSRFLEYGHRPPYAVSVGSGAALVLRDGRAYRARWSRPTADGGTTFSTAAGQPMTFARGQVWVILAAGPGGYHGR
ncbi:MAG TPA: DUF3048 domain-containing protein [Streptosporangiaceae bacterium]|jgi:hypothetical protein